MKANSVIGFLGAGKMATALAQGFLGAGLVTPDRLWASDVSEAALKSFANVTGAGVTTSNLRVVEASDVLVLAVKPDQIEALQREAHPGVDTDRHLVISIAAGLTLARLEAAMPRARLVRVMPNTPALVGAGATAFALGAHASRADAELVKRLFESVGLAVEVKEKLLDAVTGLSGSGPAYAFIVLEALADGGVAAGLPRDVATQLAAQTLLGAAKMVLRSGRHPGELKDAVCSPGGTTIEGVHEMEKAGVRAGLMSAVRASAAKSRQMGQS